MNIVVEIGSSAVLTCGVANPEVSHSLQWHEYAYNEGGSLISDNGVIMGHPEAERYEIITTTPGHYDLQISDVRLADGGTYVCIDLQTGPPNKRQHAASLTVVGVDYNCTTTIQENGIVHEGDYNTNDCILEYQGTIVPNMTWSGQVPFDHAYVASDSNIWAGMKFFADRDHDELFHTATTYFSSYFLPVDGNTASNVPVYQKIHEGTTMTVYWGPKNLAASPIKDYYEVGNVLTCTADAKPLSTFTWANMRTLEIYEGNILVIPESWRGYNQTLRCQARNIIEGLIYSDDIFIPAYVPPLTSPTTTTTEPTTTPPPPVSDCRDLTGAWFSTAPTMAALCVRLNLDASGLLTGLLRNDTDTYWVDIVGRAQAAKFDQVGFNGIWPHNIGVSSFIGECHRCFGEEQLLVNVISRSVGNQCGVKGPTRYTTEYLFTRNKAIVCPNIPNYS